MSISHWGMFFGYHIAVAVDGVSPGTYRAAWVPCSVDDIGGW